MAREAERAEGAGADDRDVCLGGGLGVGTKSVTRTDAAGPLPLLLLRLVLSRKGGSTVSPSSSFCTTCLKFVHSVSTPCFNLASAACTSAIFSWSTVFKYCSAETRSFSDSAAATEDR